MAVISNLPTIGTDVEPDVMFRNTINAPQSGLLGRDTDWAPYTAAFRVTAR